MSPVYHEPQPTRISFSKDRIIYIFLVQKTARKGRKNNIERSPNVPEHTTG